MTFAQYGSDSTDLCVQVSTSESDLVGLRVGRMVLSERQCAKPSAVLDAIRESELDVVVLRYPASEAHLSPHLQDPGFVSWQADTLMYFEAGTGVSTSLRNRVRLRELDESEFDSATSALRLIFHGYGNHYAGSPVFGRIDTAAAYVDWTRRETTRKTSAVLGLEVQADSDPQWELAGVCVVDETARTYDEILLAGVHPSFRRKGLYSDALAMLKSRASERSKERVLISTQATNIPALKAWVRSGFEPILTLNTLHIARSGVFDQLVNARIQQ